MLILKKASTSKKQQTMKISNRIKKKTIIYKVNLMMKLKTCLILLIKYLSKYKKFKNKPTGS